MRTRAQQLPARVAQGKVEGVEGARVRASSPSSPACATDVRAKNGGGPFGRRWFLAVAFRRAG